MNTKTALKTILGISIFGAMFSGYLSYTELTRQLCFLGTCNSQVFSIPSCVYGFSMYLIIVIISLLGLKKENKK